ncbi:MAG: hypothetical protein JST54_14625 [Deltaproteobacteria bacterium]|nr:hypothetical protein [Deltaproteobacteria bacterium]
MFASKTIVEHLARGAVGLGSLAGASVLFEAHPAAALGLVALGMVALRGCPMCWTMGLVETIATRVRGQRTDGLCTDGTCSRRAT